MMAQENERIHGRFARGPQEIPKRGWIDIAKRVSNEISKDNVSIIAAGITYFAFLAIFPAIAAIIALYGLFVDPQTVQQQFSALAQLLPDQVAQMIKAQLSEVISSSPTALGWGLVLSVLLSLWSANNGTAALFQGINIAYEEVDKRGFIKSKSLTLLFTLLGVIMVIISMTLVIGLPAAIGALGLPSSVQTIVMVLRWVVLAVLLMAGLSAIYRYAPDRENPKWRWVSWGSVAATILWIFGSLAFSFYVKNFSSYNATYGSLAAVVIMLFWLYLSSFVILLGAEINSEIEHQTKVDSTTGKEKSMGSRGANMADDIGEAA